MPILPDPKARRRRRRRHAVSAVLTLVLLAVVWRIHGPGDQPETSSSADVVASPDRTSLATINGLRILSLNGPPLDIGREHGLLLKTQVRRMIDEFLYGSYLPAAEVSREQAVALARAMAEQLPQTQVDELKGLADGAGVDYDDLLVLQAFPELGAWGDSTGYAALTPATRDQDLLFRYEFDLAPADLLADCGVILAYKAEGARGFVGLGLAGLLAPLAAMNADGLCIALLRSDPGELGTTGGEPLLSTMRRVIEEAENIKDASRLIERIDRTIGCNFLVGQTESDLEAAVIEQTPTAVTLRVPEEGRLAVSNHFRALADPPLADSDLGACARFDTLRNWLFDHAGELDYHLDAFQETGCYGDDTVAAVTLLPLSDTIAAQWQPTTSGSTPAQRLTWNSSTGEVAAEAVLVSE